MRCLFLLPFIAIFALHLLLSPPTHMEGPVHLLPMMRRMRRRYTLPPPPLQTQKQAGFCPPQLPYVAALPITALFCLFLLHTERSQHGGTNPYYNTLLQSISVNSPHNTPYNSKWVLQCGDVHPNPGHRRIYQLRRDYRLVPGPDVPLLDIEEYAHHLVMNSNRQYDSLDNIANEQD